VIQTDSIANLVAERKSPCVLIARRTAGQSFKLDKALVGRRQDEAGESNSPIDS
jgi:hypothetical protein